VTPDSNAQGALTEGVYFILVSMLQPRHGYAVMQYIAELTGGRVSLGAGTLYGAINTLLEKDWIRALPSPEDSRQKRYVITADGRRVLESELARLQQLVTIGQTEIEANKT